MRLNIEQKKEMKKLLAMLLVGVMVLGTIACGKKEEKPVEPPVVESPENDEIDEPVIDETGEEGDLADLEVMLSETEQIITKIYEHISLEFPAMTILLDAENNEDPEYFKSYTGLATDENVEQAAVSEALISSQAYSLVVVKVNEGADAEAMAEEMKAGINPAKGVCVEADDLDVVVNGRYICLAMISSEYAEMATAADLTEAFNLAMASEGTPAEPTEGPVVEGEEMPAVEETVEEVVDAEAETTEE